MSFLAIDFSEPDVRSPKARLARRQGPPRRALVLRRAALQELGPEADGAEEEHQGHGVGAAEDRDTHGGVRAARSAMMLEL